MSNHIHLILEGTLEDVAAFVTEFKRRYSKYYQRKYGIREFLRENGVDIRPVGRDGESLERAVAYVQMNCVAANICLHPGQYPWGTGNAFFQVGQVRQYRRLGDLSGRERIRLLHSEEALRLPGEWLISDAGYVLPEMYVNARLVESVFRSPKRMQYFLNSSSKAKKRLEGGDTNLPAFKDQTILRALPDPFQIQRRGASGGSCVRCILCRRRQTA